MATSTPSKRSRQTTTTKGTPNRRSSRQAKTSNASSTAGRKRPAETDDEEEMETEEPESRTTKVKGKVNTRRKATGKKRVKNYDSDALDEDSDFDANEDDEQEEEEEEEEAEEMPQKVGRKRRSPSKASSSPRKRRRGGNADDDEDEEEEIELKEGQEIVGVIVQAPKTGRVPPGQISQNTFDFLQHLADPKYNDREWFKLHEPVYRLAEKEFKDFVDSFTEVLTEVDPHVPPLPPKDVIHRIYRDIRFSNDKTPYKRSLSASFSRGGRKSIWACFRPGGESLLAAGTWCPGKNELATIRSNIAHSSDQLRQVISEPAFVALFGEPTPIPKSKNGSEGGRRNIFGAEDELKVAPKGFHKDHKDIDLLKCRTFAVVHRFTDAEVLAPDFKTKLSEVASVVRPFVRCMNNLMTIQERGDEENGDEDGENEPQ